MQLIPAARIVLDFALYPRIHVDGTYVGLIAAAMDGGTEVPPLIVDLATKRLVDGFHRYRAYVLRHGPKVKIPCLLKRYKTEADVRADAMRYNAHHGRYLTSADRVRCVLIGQEAGMTIDQVAGCLGMTIERLTDMYDKKIAVRAGSDGGSRPVVIKAPISHMAGRTLTKRQEEVNAGLGGNSVAFIVQQLIDMLEADLIDTTNAKVMTKLRRLKRLIPD